MNTPDAPTQDNEPEPQPQARRSSGGGTKGATKGGTRGARRRSREVALQGLYEWLLSGADVSAIEANLREQEGFEETDRPHLDALLGGCIAEASAIDAVLAKHVDRRTDQLSPVEHAVLMIGVFELTHCLEIPYRVVINEAVELAKSFGGTDGHKYVNGVLDKAASQLRPVEVEANPRARRL